MSCNKHGRLASWDPEMVDEKKPTRNHLISRKKVNEFVAHHPRPETTSSGCWPECKLVEKDGWQCFCRMLRGAISTVDLIGEK